MGRQHEVGLAVSRVGERPYVNEEAQHLGQAWWSNKHGQRWLSSILLGFDEEALFAGAGLRFDAVQSRRFTGSVEAELGFGWAALSVPLSLRPTERVGAYCSPRLGNWGAALAGFLPCGVSVEVASGLVLRAEAQLSWADFEYYNRRLHLGIGLAHQW